VLGNHLRHSTLLLKDENEIGPEKAFVRGKKKKREGKNFPETRKPRRCRKKKSDHVEVSRRATKNKKGILQQGPNRTQQGLREKEKLRLLLRKVVFWLTRDKKSDESRSDDISSVRGASVGKSQINKLGGGGYLFTTTRLGVWKGRVDLYGKKNGDGFLTTQR